jgi:hypothetical protein
MARSCARTASAAGGFAVSRVPRESALPALDWDADWHADWHGDCDDIAMAISVSRCTPY